jgi:geranylgeranyl pyrophosphate synthase
MSLALHKPAKDPAQVPSDATERQRLREAAERYAREAGLKPPLAADAIRSHAETLAGAADVAPDYLDFLQVLVGNAVWSSTVAAVPFDRRLLLLPQCLSRPPVCRAERDDVGLLCADCGACPIAGLQAEAERLGYVTLVAEGTTVVRRLILTGAVDAIVGVGCLEALERVLPDMCSHAIPGLGVPLLCAGCRETEVDAAWVLEVLRSRTADGAEPLCSLESLRTAVEGWFEAGTLDALLGPPSSPVERVARAWLAGHGKRWRPLLTAGTFASLNPRADVATIRPAAVAVECFHKASLVHDDIEDADDTRYGQPTLHREHGVPVAINAGDYLIGEGYRLLAATDVPPERRVRLLETAARGHLLLCQGQGEELDFAARLRPLSVEDVLRIAERKTAAAFEVALMLGAATAGADDATCAALSRFSRAVGVAYQIRDDLEDGPARAAPDAAPPRPSILFALACQSPDATAQRALAAWQGASPDLPAVWRALSTVMPFVRPRAVQLLEYYRREAERALADVPHTSLRLLLRRVCGRVFEAAPVP